MPLRFLTAGESHGPALIAILEGLPAGLELDVASVQAELARRQRGYGAGPRMKLEQDQARILSGLMAGKTIGSPLSFEIENLDHPKWHGREIESFTTPRPGHADLTGAIKYAYRDLRPALERASARETAARVAVGAVCKQFLAVFGIRVGGYVQAIGRQEARLEGMPYVARFEQAEASDVRCPDLAAAEAMRLEIRRIIESRDTLGGVLEIVALGLPPGLGSYAQWDRRLEGRLGSAILSVPAIKGVEIGQAFENARLPGTQAHDAIQLAAEQLTRPTNRAGGLEGGVTNGEPLILRAAMKPIATTLEPQRSVDLSSGREVPTRYERSDFCPVPRAVPILEAMVAFILADALLEKVGGDSIEEILPRVAALRGARLGDLPMDGSAHVWWPD